ncbi:alpha-mannosidase 2-like isoform X1 [Planococcus citri]|uniref:alpha-mannosidase 2-like isoform X1 n=1 Tax=Planococcus citri TaxID=170843 RepID=UPI0031F97FEF
MRVKKKLLFFSVLFFISTVLYYLLNSNFFKKNNKISDEQPAYAHYKARVFIALNHSHGRIRQHHEDTEHKCESIGSHSSADIQMFNVYKELKFDNLDGGAWKQGWNVQVDTKRWNTDNKLKVFVVPHSHNDPGWLKTFEHYYETQTRFIFNNMIEKLRENPHRKFIWAEVSYLSLWWNEVSEVKRNRFKELVDNGQIEIVTGGWVMTDEANSHYYSIIQQLTHGHQWLRDNLQIEPKRSWSIDPFGVSPTMPFLLGHFGLESLVVQRTHYAVKKYLAKHKQLEFRWRQFWDGSGKHDFFTHMMPFYGYDIPHTCGPDPAICCQFDFKRTPQFSITCPWKKPPQMINDKNVAFRAELLLDQYRKKAELYDTNVLLIPLGDDFRYDVMAEWDLQYQNYQKLFDYMNKNPSFHVEAKFGTLQDYFEAVENQKSADAFPSLQGDFFTYADRDDYYWSGYYTSRPYYKRMDRELMSSLRSAEILHSLAWKSAALRDSKWLLSDSTQFIKLLRQARASLSLFQHHDGITGTAKDDVVNDYADKLQKGMDGAELVMQQSLNFILNPNKDTTQRDPEKIYFELKESRKTPSSDRKHKMISLTVDDSLRRVVVFNSLSWHRIEILNLKIDSNRFYEIIDEHDNLIPYQVNPFCEINDHGSGCHLIHFKVDIRPLEIKTFFLRYNPELTNDVNMASLKIMNSFTISSDLERVREFIKDRPPVSEFSIQNEKLSVAFRPNGLIKAISLKNTDFTVPIHLHFIKYGCRHQSRVMCGAYLFIPDGDARTVDCADPMVKIIEGKLISSVITYCDYVVHAVNIFNAVGPEEYGVEIQNLVDIRTEKNFEIGMKISTNVKNDGIFYTDLNGYQIVKRQYLKKLPLQANYYPMPSSIYIEDEKSRVTVVSAQPLGASSIGEGEIEVMMDRRLNQDDELGLGQGVLDNKPILNVFRLVVEKKMPNCKKVPESHLAGYLSVISYLSMNAILYPLTLFVRSDIETKDNDLLTTYSISTLNTSVDVHIVSMTTLPETSGVGLVLHRAELDTCVHQEYEHYILGDGMVNLTSFVPVNENDVVCSSSLSFVNINDKSVLNNMYNLCPMDLAAFYVGNRER